MFGNFIYFIVVLLIYLTYQPSEETNFTGFQTWILFWGLIALFFYLTLLQFQRLEKRIAQKSFVRLDHQFNAIMVRQSVMAIALFAIDIYGLNLSSYFINLQPFKTIPTFLALLFLGLFVAYLAIVWTCAYGVNQKLYRTDISRKSYVTSNISFSVPVLLPWLMLSGIADIIQALPFESPKRFLNTTEGEVIYFLFFLFAVAVIGPAMIQKFWRCTPLEHGHHRERIERLCRKAEMAYKDILYWPIFGGRMITAGVMGLIKKFRYILVTPSLLSLLGPEEIDAVIAHEIGHIKKKHLVFYLVFFVGYMLISYVVFDLIIYALIYAEPIYRFISESGVSQTTLVSGIFSVIIICIFLLYFRFIFGFFMRNFERQADIFVYTVLDTARPLISTLEKIAVTSGQPPDRPNWHHFSIKERIDYLSKCELNTHWITRHERKVSKSIGIYLVGLILVGVLGYQLNMGEFGSKLNNHFIEKAILRELEKSPDNPNLYSLLGDLYYESKNFSGVRDAYEKSLMFSPENPHVLNNLAWLYATCEDESLRDYERALMLAQKAVALEQSPHIWDTLAESYYVNGMAEEALEAGHKALAMAKSNRSYYNEQIQRFKAAMKKQEGRNDD